jgi:hypothetical protein
VESSLCPRWACPAAMCVVRTNRCPDDGRADISPLICEAAGVIFVSLLAVFLSPGRPAPALPPPCPRPAPPPPPPRPAGVAEGKVNSSEGESVNGTQTHVSELYSLIHPK